MPRFTHRQVIPIGATARVVVACDQQDRPGELMRADPAAGQATWPLRGELISQPDRLGHELGRANRSAARAACSAPSGG